MSKPQNTQNIFRRESAAAFALASKPQNWRAPGCNDETIHYQSRGREATGSVFKRKRAREHQTPSTTKNGDENKVTASDCDKIRGIDNTPFKRNTIHARSSTSTLKQPNQSSVFHRSSNKASPYPFNPYSNARIKGNPDASKWSSGIDTPDSQDKSSGQIDNDDYYAGIDDNDILEIDDTPFKSAASSTIDVSTPPSLLSKVMMLSSSETQTDAMFTGPKEKAIRQEKKKSEIKYDDSCISPTNVVTNLDSNEFETNRSDGRNESDEKNTMLSFDQLTQEEADFDAMFDLLEHDAVSEDAHMDEIKDEVDESETHVPNNRNSCKSKAFKQPSLSQYYPRESGPTKPKPRIPSFVEWNGRHFMKGDVWQLKPEASKDHDRNLIVKIKSFSTNRGREKKAIVEDKYYLPIESVFYIGSDQAPSVIEARQSKGRLGPGYVEYKRMKNCSGTTTSGSFHAVSLDKLANQIKENVASDLVFGFEGINKKAGCFFKSIHSGDRQKKRVPIPKDSQGSFTVLELYSGAGGFSLGLEEAGFSVTHHVDNDTAACSTLQANFRKSNVLQCSVEDFLRGCLRNPKSKSYPRIGSITMIHGSTPCQGFSLANRNGGANDAANNAETYQFMDVVKHFQPPFVTFENVQGMTIKINIPYVQKMVAEFLTMNYQVRICQLDASEYGDPQKRERFFILAAKEGLMLPDLPQPTHGKGLPHERKTTADALGFLENIPPLDYEGEVWAKVDGVETSLRGHVLRSSERKPDDVDLTAGDPAPTVLKRRVIRHYKNSKRPLTVLERSQLQSFPPTFDFKGTHSERLDQIGNAVPVCLARAIGKSVMKAIRESGG